MTTEQLSITRADAMYKLLAATGFLIGAFADLEELNRGKLPFTQSLKYSAKKFQEQLLSAELVVAGPNLSGKVQEADQLFDSYQLVDHLLSVALLAGRKLTPAAQKLLNEELEGVARKWGVFPD